MSPRMMAPGFVFCVAVAAACSGPRTTPAVRPGKATRPDARKHATGNRTDATVTRPGHQGAPSGLSRVLRPYHPFKKAWAERATVWFVGTYGEGSYPCRPGPGGSLDMIQQNYFKVTEVLKGTVAVRTVDVNPHPRRNDSLPPYLIEGRSYLVLLKPDRFSLGRLRDVRTIFTLETMIRRDEIVAVVDLSQGRQEAETARVQAHRSGAYGGVVFTPQKWTALRLAGTVDFDAQKRFLSFIRNVVLVRGGTLRNVRAYLGEPDRQLRTRHGAHGCVYQLNLKAYRKPTHGAIYTELGIGFGAGGRLVHYTVKYYKWSVTGRSSSSRELGGSGLGPLGLRPVKVTFRK